MSEKISWYFFILCGILCQAIIRISSEDVAESTSLIRRKRVISLVPGEDNPVPSRDATFVVNIRKLPRNTTMCVGSILSSHSVITSAAYVSSISVNLISILAGSSYNYRGEVHNVEAKQIHLSNPHSDSIALLTVKPAFIFNNNINPIALHTEPLLAGTPATIYGWGCNPKQPRGTKHRDLLRSITLPLMLHRDCLQIYRNRATILDKHICTYDANKFCGHTDLGAPLVVHDKLAGIHIWKGDATNHINPDVFLILQHEEYAQWIRQNIEHAI